MLYRNVAKHAYYQKQTAYIVVFNPTYPATKGEEGTLVAGG